MTQKLGCWFICFIYLGVAYLAYGWTGVFWAMPLFVIWFIIGIATAVLVDKNKKEKEQQ